MSIKKLFESADKSRNYLSETNEKDAFKDVESAKNVEQLAIKQNTFVPDIDYRYPQNFAKFGSAYYYYSGAIGRLVDYYPYDGSDAEQNEFYNRSLDVEKFIFNDLYPRVNGYANFDSSSYIDFKGGPHGISYKKAAELFANPADSKRHRANIYDKNIYETAGLPNTYGTGSRESNLRANFNSGVTVEFWLKSRKLAESTGSATNQVIFDMWNNNASGSHDMGRLTIEVLSASSGTPFRFTVQSGSMTSATPGSGTLFQQSIGQTVTPSTLSDWNHYAFVFQNSGSAFTTKFYLNGYLNHTVINSDLAIGELPSKDMVGRIGNSVTRPFKADGTTTHIPVGGVQPMTGAIDEFRFWKTARNPEEIGINWFTQVRGGTNTDISNTTLGVYYKFNEGNSGFGYLDSNVLDYSGRLTNGTWTGTPSRTLSSAMIEASASTSEYKDPIIYSQHPDVVSLRNDLFASGSHHDGNNTSNLKSLMPSWIIEEHEQLGNKNPELISHIVGAYFDKIYGQIEALANFKKQHYTSASSVPLPFAEHLPQSLGLYTPQLFVDSDVVARFLNKTEDFQFENDLTETKNLIYLNLYNNLTNIYKTKGTEKSIKNVFRCFNLDDSVVKLKTYVDNELYTLDSRAPRLEQVLKSKKALFFNTSSHVGGVCYQFQDPDDTTGTRGYISGSGIGRYENKYGFTAEVDFTLPAFDIDYDSVVRDFRVASVFGMYTASTEAPDTLTWPAYDGCNFQVYVVKEEKHSKNAFFMLSSSYVPQTTPTNMPTGSGVYIPGTTEGPFPILTSSVYFDAYDNTNWNLSVRLKPSKYPYAEVLSGSDVFDTYDLIFQGLNTKLGAVENRFTLSASISKSTAEDFLSGSKRLYVGANRKDFAGDLRFKTDVRMFNAKYWGKYLDDDSLTQHIYDLDNSGISGSFSNISPLDPNNDGYDILNSNLLVLDWNFSDVTGSDSSGNFITQDMSSGSAQTRRAFGWVGGLSGYKHTGKGIGFKPSSTSVSKNFNINTYKFIEPESPVTSDAINILTGDDETYGFPQIVPNFHYSLEKSLQAAVSDEMLNFFAGVIDFNNLIGEPVNRYRSRYKRIEKLREAFFRKVTTTTQVEDYIKYYQWFDDSLSAIVAQLMPASGRFSEDVYNVVESHVLERNKYKSQFPTIEFRLDDPITPILGINERLYNWKYNHAPLSMSNGGRPELEIEPGVGGPLTGSELQKVNSRWWRDRAERRESHISSGNNDVDNNRDNIRRTIENDNNQKLNVLNTLTSGVHSGSAYVLRKLAKPYKFHVYRKASPVPPIKGGVNFEKRKKIDFTYNALRPAGPINDSGSAYVPENVLFGDLFDSTTGKEIDILKLRDSTDPEYSPWFNSEPNSKIYRRAKIQHGRNWEGGTGYQSVKSDISFPFNIVSSSVKTGYNKLVDDRVMSGVMITNLHNDVYGPDMESPMQGPFTNYAVGGHQSRHVRLNKLADNSTHPTGSVSMNSVPSAGDTLVLHDGSRSVTFTFRSTTSDPEDVGISGTPQQTMLNLVAVINSYPNFKIRALTTSNASASLTNVVDYKVGPLGITTTGDWPYEILGMAGGSGGFNQWDSRPEAWKILLGKCDDPLKIGAIGMVGPDYPLANASGTLLPVPPYPATASQKAVYYRDFVAKRPVNIRNIKHTTGSTILGNYEHNYQVIQAPGGFSNPRQFIENQPNLPKKIFSSSANPSEPGYLSSSTSIRTLLDIYRGSRDGLFTRGTPGPLLLTGAAAAGVAGHTDFSGDYSTEYLQKTTNNSVIVSRFSAPGGIEISTRGYQDFRSSEFSVYNMMNSRNLTVRRPFQSHPIVSGSAEENGIRVYDIHGNDYGFTVHAARHTERFFRDSILVPTNQGATYDQKPAFHRVHRNNMTRPKLATERFVANTEGSELSQSDALYFGNSEQFGHLLLNAESASCTNFLTSSRSTGFTYSAWIRCAPTDSRAHFFSVGKAGATSKSFIQISKISASLSLYVGSRSNASGFGGSHTRARYDVEATGTLGGGGGATSAGIGALNDGQWVHLAVVLPVSAGVNGPSYPAIYLNGESQIVIETASPQQYFDQKIDESAYSVLNSVPRRSDAVIGIGHNAAVTSIQTDALTGALDQISLWTVALSSSDVTEIYNSGTPCDITGSSAYEGSGSHLFGWYKLGEGNQTDVIATSNPKVFNSASNAIWNSHTAENHFFPVALNTVTNNDNLVLSEGGGDIEGGWYPASLEGCTPTLLGYSSSFVLTCSNFYDNLNHYHPIPRSDRQYAWMTGAMQDTDPCNHRYSGYMPVFGDLAGLYYSHTASVPGDFEAWMTMITASDYGLYLNNAGTRYIFGSTKLQSESVLYGGKGWIPVDFAGLNTIIYEPITSSTNTLGYPLNVKFPTASTYRDKGEDRDTQPWPDGRYYSEFVDATSGPTEPGMGTPAVGFNALMLHRNGPYGYGTHAQVRRNPNHPVLRNERSASELSVITWAEHDEIDPLTGTPTGVTKRTSDVTNFTLPPVSMRGRPAFLNYLSTLDLDECGEFTSIAPGTITLKITDNNLKTYFNSHGLNTHTKVNPAEVLTPLDYALSILDAPSGFGSVADVNYLIYSENVFPSIRMEFVSSSRRRTNYNNLFWRDNQVDRVALGATVDDSFRNLYNRDDLSVSQSSWPLDAQEDFLTRTSSVISPAHRMTTAGEGELLASASYLLYYGKAGELQNNYSQYHFDRYATGSVRNTFLSYISRGFTTRNAPLYARKQMFAGARGVGATNNMHIPETGSFTDPGADIPSGYRAWAQWEENDYFSKHVQTASGEALWEAGSQAGIVSSSRVTEGLDIFTHEFKSYKSEPWYDNYNDFREQIRLLAKDYAIVPEFRIHNIVNDLVNLDPSSVKSVYEIPGTGIFDSTSSFFRDYTNSERLAYFRDIGAKTTMTPKEIRITVHAVKKFNPYKGFYPAQRTLDLVGQFRDSYLENISTELQYVTNNTTLDVRVDTYGNTFNEFTNVARPVIAPLFSPGLLYNSIKSGMAVDFPVLEATVAKPNYVASYSPTASILGTMPSMHAYAGYANPAATTGSRRGGLVFTIPPKSVEEVSAIDSSSWDGGAFWDKRLPFETLLDPASELLNLKLSDLEVSPSSSIPYTASLIADGNDMYKLMARNFLGETANFFLKNGDFSTLKSETVPESGIMFQSGTYWGARIKLRRSMNGHRYYFNEWDSAGFRRSVTGSGGCDGDTAPLNRLMKSGFGATGGRMLLHNSGADGKGLQFTNREYPLPQDPAHDPSGSATFVMYSRTTAFGPPVSGRAPGGAYDLGTQTTPLVVSNHLLRVAVRESLSGALDCFTGHNWSFTPPYYHGEAWCDVLFYPDETRRWKMDEILNASKAIYWRVDPGPTVLRPRNDSPGNEYISTPALIGDYWLNYRVSASLMGDTSYIGGGRNVNQIAMQLSASVNLFGIQRVRQQTFGPGGGLLESVTTTSGMRWVIKPKWETPHMNFNSPIRTISANSGTLTLPENYGSGTVPRGMWHQFGIIDPDPNRGIFMEINDIPRDWLQSHYKVVNEPSLYNKGNPGFVEDSNSNGHAIKNKMSSLTSLLGFNTKGHKRKLGQLAQSKTISEAVVVIPYTLDVGFDEALMTHPETVTDERIGNKQFFGIDDDKIVDALRANALTPGGMSLGGSGESVRKLVSKMDKYILPLEFDFLRNPDASPIVMYIFEFKHTFDRDDLSYMWQNLAPRNYKNIDFEEQSIAHVLDSTELLSAYDLFSGYMSPHDVRFMVFKVKQKAVGDYYKHVLEQAPPGDGGGLVYVGPHAALLDDLNPYTRFTDLGIRIDGSDMGSDETSTDLGSTAGVQIGNPSVVPVDTITSPEPGSALPARPPEQLYEAQYNWPYDYLSIVEGVKVDVDIMYDDESNRTKSLISETPGGMTAMPPEYTFPGVLPADPYGGMAPGALTTPDPSGTSAFGPLGTSVGSSTTPTPLTSVVTEINPELRLKVDAFLGKI